MPRLLLTLCVLFLISPGVSAASPNVVFMLADDLGYADVAFHGGNAPTPHLDALAKGGVDLMQHYVAPVCSPTRSAVLSGRYWSRFGVTNPQSGRAYRWEQVTLPLALREAGYDTAIVGKWHLGSLPEWGPRKFGFDHSYGSFGGGTSPFNHRYKEGPYTHTWHRDDVRIEEQGHVTDLLAAEAVSWITSRGEKPFFLYVPFTAVHLPIKEPEEWLAKVPKGIEDGVPRHYAACVMHLDDAVGQIVKALDDTGKRNNTLVVFTSDNGGSWVENNDTKYPGDTYPAGKLTGNNTPWRGQKGQLYEGGIHVAAIASWPGKLQPSQMTSPVSIVDWMPTICRLAGAKPAGDLKWDGRDIWPLLTGQAKAEPRLLYWAGVSFKSQAVRDGDWKLIVDHGKKPGDPETVELFDLSRDPQEKTDLASRMPDKVKELQAKLAEAAARDHDAEIPDSEKAGKGE